MFDLYLITPEQTPERIERAVARALEGSAPGRIAVQLRAKHLSALERRALGERLRRHTRAASCCLLVNAELALCSALDADGVQLPEHGPSVAEARAQLGPARWIGASRHDLPGVRAAASAGASFATLSPICASPGKGAALGFDTLRAVTRSVSLPIVALGGLALEHVPSAIGAGAQALAMIRSVLDRDDPAREVQALLAAIDEARARAAEH